MKNINRLQFAAKVLNIFWLFLFFAIAMPRLSAQATYKMGNNKVALCKGKLTDSEGNQQSAKKYANNEDYIFTVCASGASSINVKFNGAFCTEAGSDFLNIYAGGDTTGTLIKTMSGSISNPGAILVSDACVTFYFHSDKNIVCDGWDLSWEAKITSVPQPVFSAIANPTCNTSKIRVILDQLFSCDSVKPSCFTLSGAMSASITNVSPVACNSDNESNTFDITFASGLNRSGSYSLDFNSSFKDACDSIWKIHAKLSFKITDCPIRVELFSNKYYLCKGTCAYLSSIVTGGNAINYVYTWLSGGIVGAPPKMVCPTANTRYILRVTDGVSPEGLDTLDIVMIDPPNAQNDTTVCQSGGAFDLTASPAGGTWFGFGITNKTNGTFNPSITGAGTFRAYYYVGACMDSVIITVKGLNPGTPAAACPSSAPFLVTGFSPPGGVWSGPNITATGIVTPPSTPGSFKVTYTRNGCSGEKTIFISTIILQSRDTICQSKPLDTFTFYPPGGSWTGPGVTNTQKGISAPPTAGPGTKVYTYRINGCRDSFRRFIQGIDAGIDDIACPDATQITLSATPTGGYWTGKGIYDGVAGIFHPDSFKVPNRSTFDQVTLTYHANNGCKDQKILYMRYTRFYIDTIRKCVSDTAFFMRYEYLYNDPWNMYFTGDSALTGNQVYYQKFSPAKAGRGSYKTIIGEANGCRDTLVLHVYPRARIQKDTSCCIADLPFFLYNGEKTGIFYGNGITNIFTGEFDPARAGKGTHTIYFSIWGRCTDTLQITVNALPSVSMTGLRSYYCMKDTLVNLVLNPLNGVLSGNGTSSTFFNPVLAGPGSHLIRYTVGQGKCISESSMLVTVGEPLTLTLTADRDTLCAGETVALKTQSGGGSGNYDLQWSSGHSGVESIYVLPRVSTLYSVELNDGCSDSVLLTKSVYVHPVSYGRVMSSPIQCHGQQGFAEITMNGAGPYAYQWNSNPPQTGQRINASVGATYKVNVRDLSTGCAYDTMATIPGYERIRAYFLTSPAGQCIYTNNARLQLINLSEGGLSGVWDFGDGHTEPYDPLTNPSYTYQGDTDNYTIRLLIRNAGNCMDSFSANICVLDTITLFIPNAFSPNGDGVNDVFRLQTTSLSEANIEIYNRWGEKVFATDNSREGWDGYYGGRLCPTDFYMYVVKYKGKKTPWRYQKGYFYLTR
jgi:gliding motility-associated-like protein